MSLPSEHFKATRTLIRIIDKKKIAKWLIKEGYFPEQYVLPPCFNVEKFNLRTNPYFLVTPRAGGRNNYTPTISEISIISFPKSQLTDRIFGIIEPQIYHDMVWHIINEWNTVLNSLFHRSIKIYPYSFPIPVSSKSEGSLGTLRAGRMIYEFLEMAESDLVAEAHKYKYIIKTDIKNFYPSIYTHSISWALHGKTVARKDREKYNLLGTKLDRLCQRANDGCTNGLPIGPAISDLISEILLSAIDRECSKILTFESIDFLGTRFKDDYRFLCNSKNDAERIIKVLQNEMRHFNLTLNEGKSEIRELPEGLFRPWKSEYNPYSLKYRKSITYARFEQTLLEVLKINKKHPDTGIIDKFLSELIFKDYSLKLKLKNKNALQAISLLLLLKERRARAFPQVLAIIELIIEANKEDKDLIASIASSLERILTPALARPFENQYDLLWLGYFLCATDLVKITWPLKKSPLLNSISGNTQKYFTTPTTIKLYRTINRTGRNTLLAKHLDVFPKD